MRADSADAHGEGPATDPLADLLFTLIAAVLPAILLLAPLSDGVRHAVEREATRRTAQAREGTTLRGAPVHPVVARAAGLSVDGRFVPLDHIDDDPGLVAALDGMRAAHQPLLLLIEPDGGESAFLFEPVAAAHAPSRFDEVRLTSPCADADETARALCGSLP